MARPAVGVQTDFRVRLAALGNEAGQLQLAAESAYASRDMMKPLVRTRDALKQELSKVNAQTPRDAIKARQIEQGIKRCNRKIDKAVEPFTKFTDTVKILCHQLKSALRFLALSPGTKELRTEIEQLPLLTRGLGHDWMDVRDDLLAIRMRLSELAAQSTQRGPSLRIEIPPDTKWESIQIRFLSDETVEITTPASPKHYNFAELGFEDRRKKGTPNTAWVTLRELAKGIEITRKVSKPSVVEKSVQALRKSLKNLFGLSADPFQPYHNVKCYTPRFNLSFPRPDDR